MVLSQRTFHIGGLWRRWIWVLWKRQSWWRIRRLLRGGGIILSSSFVLSWPFSSQF